MKKQIRNNIKKDVIHVCVEVEFKPFPSKEKKHEAYRTHAKLFLRAKEKEVAEDGKT